MTIIPVGAELFHTDGRIDKYGEVNSRFRNFAKATNKASRVSAIREINRVYFENCRTCKYITRAKYRFSER